MRLHMYVSTCVYESLLGLHLQPITLSLIRTHVDAHTHPLSPPLSHTCLP